MGMQAARVFHLISAMAECACGCMYDVRVYANKEKGWRIVRCSIRDVDCSVQQSKVALLPRSTQSTGRLRLAIDPGGVRPIVLWRPGKTRQSTMTRNWKDVEGGGLRYACVVQSKRSHSSCCAHWLSGCIVNGVENDVKTIACGYSAFPESVHAVSNRPIQIIGTMEEQKDGLPAARYLGTVTCRNIITAPLLDEQRQGSRWTHVISLLQWLTAGS